MKHEVYDNLTVCVNERSLCGLSIIEDKDLSMSSDKKVMTLLTQLRNTLWICIKELFLPSKFDNSTPTVTRDKEIFQGHVTMR